MIGVSAVRAAPNVSMMPEFASSLMIFVRGGSNFKPISVPTVSSVLFKLSSAPLKPLFCAFAKSIAAPERPTAFDMSSYDLPAESARKAAARKASVPNIVASACCFCSSDSPLSPFWRFWASCRIPTNLPLAS